MQGFYDSFNRLKPQVFHYIDQILAHNWYERPAIN